VTHVLTARSAIGTVIGMAATWSVIGILAAVLLGRSSTSAGGSMLFRPGWTLVSSGAVADMDARFADVNGRFADINARFDRQDAALGGFGRTRRDGPVRGGGEGI
jgi:hypothetical protein